MNPIVVIGCDGSGWSSEAKAALQCADVVAGSRRLLAAAASELAAGCERVELGSGLADALKRLLEERGCRQLVILGSGDPLCCGIGGTLRRLAGDAAFRILPAPSAFQLLFARIGQPWEEVEFFSLHNDSRALPFRRMLRSKLAAVYADAARTAADIAAGLIDRFPAAASRCAAVGCNLGLPEEYVAVGTLGTIAADPKAHCSLSVLALLPDRTAGLPDFPLGISDDNYLHSKNMITHPEVRAIVLAKLRLRGGVLWDLGAGSGSVGLEAAGLCPELRVCAVERHPDRFRELEGNLAREGLGNVSAHLGSARELLGTLPDPDRIFIGGGGSELAELLECGFERLLPGGVMAATAVLAESSAVLATALAGYRRELVCINVSRSVALGENSLWKAENPITIAVFRKQP